MSLLPSEREVLAVRARAWRWMALLWIEGAIVGAVVTWAVLR